MAALWKLPLILLCENNQFAMSTRPQDTTAISDLSQRAKAFGIPGQKVDGMDATAVFDAVSEAAARARKGEGPSFIEAVCYRYEGHFSGDNLKYRPKGERAEWEERDPIVKLRDRLVNAKLMTTREADDLVQRAEAKIDDALEFAKASPLPDATSAFEDLYA